MVAFLDDALLSRLNDAVQRYGALRTDVSSRLHESTPGFQNGFIFNVIEINVEVLVELLDPGKTDRIIDVHGAGDRFFKGPGGVIDESAFGPPEKGVCGRGLGSNDPWQDIN